MKKLLAFIFVVGIAVASVILAGAIGGRPAQADNDYLRIHVRANSNSAEDQKVKYEVKDEIVKFITPYICECVDKERAMEVVKGLCKDIEEVAQKALKERGYTYGARAEVRCENFPTRVYGETTLEAGVYDALIVELGSGTGDNWWCCIYPPLCFTSVSCSVEYRSAILDIINKFKG